MPIIKSYRQQNRFPIHLINRVVENLFDELYIVKTKSDDNLNFSAFIFISYLGELSIHL